LAVARELYAAWQRGHKEVDAALRKRQRGEPEWLADWEKLVIRFQVDEDRAYGTGYGDSPGNSEEEEEEEEEAEFTEDSEEEEEEGEEGEEEREEQEEEEAEADCDEEEGEGGAEEKEPKKEKGPTEAFTLTLLP